MADNDEQTKKDALFLLDALKHVTTKITVNVGEIASQKGIKVNTIETRFSAIKKRHNLNISTSTLGFPKQKASSPKKLVALSPLKAIECPGESLARPRRAPKPSNKRPADEYALDPACLFEDGASMSSKRRMSDMDESKDVVALWNGATGDYDGDMNGTNFPDC